MAQDSSTSPVRPGHGPSAAQRTSMRTCWDVAKAETMRPGRRRRTRHPRSLPRTDVHRQLRDEQQSNGSARHTGCLAEPSTTGVGRRHNPHVCMHADGGVIRNWRVLHFSLSRWWRDVSTASQRNLAHTPSPPRHRLVIDVWPTSGMMAHIEQIGADRSRRASAWSPPFGHVLPWTCTYVKRARHRPPSDARPVRHSSNP